MTLQPALSRTTALINQVFFDGAANEEDIATGLAATTVKLTADEANMTCRAGQAALVTTTQLIARMGINIALDVPDVELATQIPPLRRATLRAALLELGEDLIPGILISAQHENTELSFCFGDSQCDDGEPIWIAASELGCCLTRDQAHARRIECDFPAGALAASAAAAAITLDAALPNIERAAHLTRSARLRPSSGPPVAIDLTKLFPRLHPRTLEARAIDVISAGAVTNTLLAVLLWLDHGPTSVRILDDDTVALDNLNRGLQFRASDAEENRAKVDVLAESTTPTLSITGIPQRFTDENREQVLPLASHVLVGVDDVQARWRVQEAQPEHLYIGATTNTEAILTSHHPGEPCAGCAHPDPLEVNEGQFVPTISFISFWAGLLQACALLEELDRPQPASRITVFPFALGERTWGNVATLPTGARCALHCPASQAA
jgi:hypothetical protein